MIKGAKALRRLLAIAAAVDVLLGTVYTAAGQDNAESGSRYVTISVEGPKPK